MLSWQLFCVFQQYKGKEMLRLRGKTLHDRPRILRCTYMAYLVNGKSCGMYSNFCAMRSYGTTTIVAIRRQKVNLLTPNVNCS